MLGLMVVLCMKSLLRCEAFLCFYINIWLEIHVTNKVNLLVLVIRSTFVILVDQEYTRVSG